MTDKTDKISAIVGNEEQLEKVINQLMAEAVARSDISVQGDPAQLKEELGAYFVNPKLIQESQDAPVTEPFMNDDFGWVWGLSFSIPLFICLIIGIFIIGDVRSTYDVWLFGILGGIVGSIIGLVCATLVKKHHDAAIKKQEKKGGYVLWVTTHTPEQYEQVLSLFKKYHLKNIKKS